MTDTLLLTAQPAMAQGETKINKGKKELLLLLVLGKREAYNSSQERSRLLVSTDFYTSRPSIVPSQTFSTLTSFYSSSAALPLCRRHEKGLYRPSATNKGAAAGCVPANARSLYLPCRITSIESHPLEGREERRRQRAPAFPGL